MTMEIEMIEEFEKEFRFLSNFWKAPMTIDGKRFVSNEQWYVYNKTTDPEVRKTILSIEDSGDVNYPHLKVWACNCIPSQSFFKFRSHYASHKGS